MLLDLTRFFTSNFGVRDNCSQAKVNSLLNSALQLFPDLVTSVGKAAGRKVSLIQGVSLNDLIQAVDSKTKSKS